MPTITKHITQSSARAVYCVASFWWCL